MDLFSSSCALSRVDLMDSALEIKWTCGKGCGDPDPGGECAPDGPSQAQCDKEVLVSGIKNIFDSMCVYNQCSVNFKLSLQQWESEAMGLKLF